VSIGKRLIDLARSELNNLLDRASRLDDEDDDAMGTPEQEPAGGGSARREPRRPGGRVRLQDLSDEELEAEIERRKLDREINDRAQAASSAGPSHGQTRAGRAGWARPGPAAGGGDAVTRAYAALEVPPGSDFDTVRKAYRNLMRKYHPDRHATAPDKQKAANELAQKLTESYKLLEKRLRRG
jgi:hypothetical protein